MNAIAFYLLAILIVAAAGAAVVVPRVRDAGIGAAAFSVVVAILSAATGAWLVAIAELILAGVGSAVVLWLLRRGGYRGLARPGAWIPRTAPVGGAVAVGFGVLLIVVFALSDGGWFHGSGDASLLTVLHYREPYAFVIALVLIALGIGLALLLGRTGDDERETDAMLAARRRREERTRTRREAREAARRVRREAPAAESGS